VTSAAVLLLNGIPLLEEHFRCRREAARA
jgi:hypothetical protein